MSTPRTSRRTRNGSGPTAAAVEAHALPAHPATDEPEALRLGSTDFARLMAPSTGRTQALQGFDAGYSDIVNYIVKCTHNIWEEMGMGLIETHYLHNVRVHTGDGWFLGRETVIANSVQSLSALPDDRAYAEDVVWTGNDQDGFYTSHLILSVGHHTGHSVYGPPTGRKILGSGIALCYVKENLICEEWLLHDDVGQIRQHGLDVDETVARLALNDAAKPLGNDGDLERMLGQYAPEPLPARTTPVDGFDVDDFVRRNLHEIWNRRMLNVVRETYAPDAVLHRAHGWNVYGRGEVTAFILSLLAAFPDARFSVDQLFWNADAEGSCRTSMRWSLIGTHEGYGLFGEPTGIRFRIWGLTQHRIRDGRIVEEWTFFNELALLKRLFLARQAQEQG
ncbi:MAG: ester cyclase [Anaerolineales bacterium]|nr:ester cyclase [Anaerolineales bacterium]